MRKIKLSSNEGAPDYRRTDGCLEMCWDTTWRREDGTTFTSTEKLPVFPQVFEGRQTVPDKQVAYGSLLLDVERGRIRHFGPEGWRNVVVTDRWELVTHGRAWDVRPGVCGWVVIRPCERHHAPEFRPRFHAYQTPEERAAHEAAEDERMEAVYASIQGDEPDDVPAMAM